MYQVIILPDAFEDLSKLDKSIAQRITDKLAWLSDNFESISPIPLQSNLSGLYKLRTGDWRIIYEVDHKNKTLYVHKVGHRREIYKIK